MQLKNLPICGPIFETNFGSSFGTSSSFFPGFPNSASKLVPKIGLQNRSKLAPKIWPQIWLFSILPFKNPDCQAHPKQEKPTFHTAVFFLRILWNVWKDCWRMSLHLMLKQQWEEPMNIPHVCSIAFPLDSRHLPLGLYCPGRHRHNWRGTLSRPRCLSRQSSALPAPLDRAVQMGFHAPGLDPHPSKCFASRPLTHGRNLPLCKFELMWTCTTCTADQIGLPLSLAFSEPSPTSFSAFSLFAELVSPLMPIELCYAQSAHALCSACCPLSPLGGGEGAQQKNTKKKKKKKREQSERKWVRSRTLWDTLELQCQC